MKRYKRYYGSEIRAKKEQLIKFVNQCLNEIEYISEKIHLYQRHIEQLQRISFSRPTMLSPVSDLKELIWYN